MGEARVVHARPELFAPVNHGFAWIRMIGAFLVIYGHSSPLVGTGELFPPEWPLQPDEGVLMGFFALSGFQITESWMRDPHPARFAVKRVLRLWPPMLTVSIGMALIVGPLVTNVPWSEYFADGNTWQYIVGNAGLLTLQHDLPGVFTDNPWPGSVNGSLWTLPMELVAYAGLYVLLLLGAARDRTRWLAVVALVALVLWDRHLEHTPDAESAGSMLSIPVESLIAFMVAFAIGVVLNLYRIPLSLLAASAALVVMVLMPNSHTGSFWMTIAISYAVIVAGHFWPARLEVPSIWVNGSYGVYVWGFPTQQVLAMAGIANQYLMLLCAAPIAYVLGTLSWKFVEEPTINLRHYITPAPKQQDEDGWAEDEEYWDDDEWEEEDDDWADEEDWDEDDWADEDEVDDAPPTQVMSPIRTPVAQPPRPRSTPAEPPTSIQQALSPRSGAQPPPAGPPPTHPSNGTGRRPEQQPASKPARQPAQPAPSAQPESPGQPARRPAAQAPAPQAPVAQEPAPAVPPPSPEEETVLSRRLSGTLDGPPQTQPARRQPPRRNGAPQEFDERTTPTVGPVARRRHRRDEN